MNNQFNDPSQMGMGPRQAPSPQGFMANGMNGMAMNGGMPGLPGMMPSMHIPAGHLSDLNSINQFVSELSQQLEENRVILAKAIEKQGEIRRQAAEKELAAQKIIDGAQGQLSEQYQNIDLENQALSHENEWLRRSRAEWKATSYRYASEMGKIRELVASYKETTARDFLAWHRSYREQLAQEREENLKLRLQIDDMQASARRLNDHHIGIRRCLDRGDVWGNLESEAKGWRREARFWKRLALKELSEDDEIFSDDDDLTDLEKKKFEERKAQIEAIKAKHDLNIDPRGNPFRPRHRGLATQAYLETMEEPGSGAGGHDTQSPQPQSLFSNTKGLQAAAVPAGLASAAASAPSSSDTKVIIRSSDSDSGSDAGSETSVQSDSSAWAIRKYEEFQQRMAASDAASKGESKDGEAPNSAQPSGDETSLFDIYEKLNLKGDGGDNSDTPSSSAPNTPFPKGEDEPANEQSSSPPKV